MTTWCHIPDEYGLTATRVSDAYRQTDSDFNSFCAGMRTRLKKSLQSTSICLMTVLTMLSQLLPVKEQQRSVHKYNQTKRETNWWFRGATLANCLQTSVDKVHSLRALSPTVAVMEAPTQQTYLLYHLVKHHVTTQAAQSSTAYINSFTAIHCLTQQQGRYVLHHNSRITII